MKKQILLAAVTIAGMATSVFGQGVFLTDQGNTGASDATANGLVYINSGGISLADLYNNNLGVEISAGLASDSLSPLGLGTYTAATDPKGYTALNIGLFYLGPTFTATDVPGASAGDVAWIQMNMWFDGPYTGDLFPSYAAALAGNGYVATALFQQQLDNGGSPPAPTTGLTGMPSVILAQVPEPTTFALGGLGMLGLLLFRRRK